MAGGGAAAKILALPKGATGQFPLTCSTVKSSYGYPEVAKIPAKDQCRKGSLSSFLALPPLLLRAVPTTVEVSSIVLFSLRHAATRDNTVTEAK
jgi:hypothetical protein